MAGILAVVFLVASSTKLFVPKEKLAGMGGAASRWVEDFSPGALKAIGALEFLAAAGLIVPAALGIAPVLVPLAATGAVLLFTGAVIMRLRRGERATIIGDLVYLAMAAFVAWAASAQRPSPGRPSGASSAGLTYVGFRCPPTDAGAGQTGYSAAPVWSKRAPLRIWMFLRTDEAGRAGQMITLSGRPDRWSGAGRQSLLLAWSTESQRAKGCWSQPVRM